MVTVLTNMDLKGKGEASSLNNFAMNPSANGRSYARLRGLWELSGIWATMVEIL